MISFKGLWVAKNFFRPESVPLNNYEKCFLFHLKSSFRSQDIQFLYFQLPFIFYLVSHWLRGWFKINRKVFDVSIFLNKNVITHFVWYLKKEKRYYPESLPIDRVLCKEHFHGKIMQKLCTKSQSRTPS